MSMEMPTGPSLSIGIAGAGLLGRLLAWQLSRAGHRVSAVSYTHLTLPTIYSV